MTYVLKRAFHPTRFQKGVYTVRFVKKGKPLVDKNMKSTQVEVRNRASAIKKARVILFK